MPARHHALSGAALVAVILALAAALLPGLVGPAGGLLDQLVPRVAAGGDLAPTITGLDNITTNEDTSFTERFTVTDDQTPANRIAVLLDTYPMNGDVSCGQGRSCTSIGGEWFLSYTPHAGFSGTDQFRVEAFDNAGNRSEQTVYLTVHPVNDAPVANADTLTPASDEDTQRTIPFSALIANDSAGPSDERGQTLTVTGVSDPTGGTVAIVGGTVVFTPSQDYNGTATFRYLVSDDGTPPATSAVSGVASFTVTPVNDAPIPYDDDLAVLEDGVLSTFVSLTRNDSAGAPDESRDQFLTVVAVTNATNGTVSVDRGRVDFIPTPNYFGPASFTYIVSDSAGATSATSATARVEVLPRPDPPVANADRYDTTEDMPLVVPPAQGPLANDQDIDGGTLAVADVTQPGNGTVTFTDQGFTYTPAADFNGTDTFTYNVRYLTVSGNLRSGFATVTIDVASTNDAPVARADTLTPASDEDTERIIPATELTSNDSAGTADEAAQTLSVATVSAPVGGTVEIVAGQVVFMPTPNFDGPASFSYTVADSGSPAATSKDAATVSFTITAVNDAPVLVDVPADIAGVEATGPGGAEVLYTPPTANDIDGDPVTMTCLLASGFTFPITTTTVTCTADDGSGDDDATDTATFTVEVIDTTAPTITVPDELILEATSPAGASIPAGTLAGIAASDLVDQSLSVTCTANGAPVTAGTVFPLETTTVICSVTDDEDNTGTAAFDVVVADTTGPDLSLPGPITVEDTGIGAARIEFEATASDPVAGQVTVTCDRASGSSFASGTTTVTCTATDDTGNTSTGTFSVTIGDTTGPTITLIGGPQPRATYTQGSVPAAPTCQTTDAASDVVQCRVYGYSTSAGRHTMIARARDTAGNATVLTRSYTVVTGTTQPPTTRPPATRPSATQPPVTQPPATQPPATRPPATQPPATQPPATRPSRPTATPPAQTPPTSTRPARPPRP